MIERLTLLQANKGQFAKGGELSKACKTDAALRHEIEVLAKHYLSKSVSGCSNCYFDAYFELINLKLETAMSKDTCKFKLKAGALLQDVVNYDNGLLCSNANITDDLALYHLKTNKNAAKYFQELPENVDELIETYQLPGEVVELSDEEKAAEAAKIEAEQAAQKAAEEKLIAEVVELLKAGTTKTAIREKFEKTNVGTKKITQRFMTELIKLAELIIEAN
jgi:hypothetical protein